MQKVRNAQRAGAAAALIADTTCLCGAPNCTTTKAPDDKKIVCETQEPIMADDGSGADISIPSFLLFKQDADIIKEELMKNQTVRVEMSFSIPAPDARVEYDLWTTAADEVSRQFLMSFKEAAIALGEHAFFTPHMYIYDGKYAGCYGGGGGENYCGNLCTNSGLYCANDPDGDLNAGISGADVVTESLRRICIWNHYGTDGIGKEWWNYVKEFMFRCYNPAKPGYFSNDKCIANAMTHAGVDKAIIDQCMADSGGLDGDDVPNSLLDASLKARDAAGVFLVPSLFVNQAPVRGEISLSTVFKAICSGYATGSEPLVCKSCAHFQDVESCLKEGMGKGGFDSFSAGGGGNGGGGGGISKTFFTMSLFLVVGIFTGLGAWHYKKTRKEMRDQVRDILAEYMPLEDQEGGMNG